MVLEARVIDVVTSGDNLRVTVLFRDVDLFKTIAMEDFIVPAATFDEAQLTADIVAKGQALVQSALDRGDVDLVRKIAGVLVNTVIPIP